MSRPSKKIAIMGAAVATASAMTVVMAAPKPPVTADVALAAATGPYTQLITGASGAVDNGLVFMGYAGGAGAAFWNPIAASSGGWLPTFTAQTTQNDLTTFKGLVNASADAAEGNVVPGITRDAVITVAAATAHTLLPVPGVTDELDTTAGTVLVPLATIADAIERLHALNSTPVLGGPLVGIPTVEGVLDALGLTATQTTFQSTFSWPLFRAAGKTAIGNTFIQLPAQTASVLVPRLLDRLTVGGLSIPDAPPEAQKLVKDTLTPLDKIVNTPSVTAWIPAGSGSYSALGYSLGFLAAAPIVVIGPVGALSAVPLPAIPALPLPSIPGVPLPAIPGIPVNPASEVVVAVPIAAYGTDLPFGIASFGVLTMPILVSPAAALVSPPIIVTYSRINSGAATSVGPNGVYYNSGTTLGLLATSVGILPVLYSLGAASAGPAGVGYVGPSVFGIGVVPPVQVLTAQPFQSVGRLVPTGVAVPQVALPAGVVPTQVPNVLAPLGLPVALPPVSLPSVGLPPADTAAVTSVGNPVLGGATANLPQITKALDGVFGPAAAEIARNVVALNAELAKAAQTIPPPGAPNGSGLPLPTATVPSVADNVLPVSAPAVVSQPLPAVTGLVEDIGVPEDAPRNRPRLNVITGTGNPGENALIGTSRTSTGGGGTTAPGGLRSTVQNAPKRVTDAVSGTVKSVTDTVSGAVSGAVGSLGKLGKGGDDG
jgi:hypothetical protein